MARLLVHYAGWGERWLLGTLAHSGRDMLFEYATEALGQGLELSPLHLKLQPQAYGAFATHQHGLPGLLADSLPDGWGLLLMDRLFRQQGLDVSMVSPLQRLAFIGERAMGALVFEPATPWAQTHQAHSLLSLARQTQQVLAGEGAAVLKQLAWWGGSPQGARPKVLVNMHALSGQVQAGTVDDAAAGFEPWLVKFPARGEHPEACAIEALYADLARRCGLDMPPTRHIELGPRLAAFAVQRFDREAGLRVPVHTLAGALHADFHLPGAVDYTTWLRVVRLFTRDEREVRKAFGRVLCSTCSSTTVTTTPRTCRSAWGAIAAGAWHRPMTLRLPKAPAANTPWTCAATAATSPVPT
jgi:serine/threonine-protein kinase HipA